MRPSLQTILHHPLDEFLKVARVRYANYNSNPAPMLTFKTSYRPYHMPATRAENAALGTRNSGRSTSQGPPLCHYHATFGKNARNCLGHPCPLYGNQFSHSAGPNQGSDQTHHRREHCSQINFSESRETAVAPRNKTAMSTKLVDSQTGKHLIPGGQTLADTIRALSEKSLTSTQADVTSHRENFATTAKTNAFNYEQNRRQAKSSSHQEGTIEKIPATQPSRSKH